MKEVIIPDLNQSGRAMPATTLNSAGVRRRPSAGRLAHGVRVAWGLFFLGSAAFNTAMLVPRASAVLIWCAQVAWPGADVLVRELIAPVAVPFAILVVGFEVLTGISIISRRWARTGLVLSLTWLAALIPFLGLYALANVVILLAMLPLIRYDYAADHE